MLNEMITSKLRMTVLAKGGNFRIMVVAVAAILTFVSNCMFIPSNEVATLKVFPGAQGFGTETPAGRGGAIVRVTNLHDTGIGSLRAAVMHTGPRIVVFEVGGHIVLNSDLTISEPFITIAGQTAPFPGIQVSGGRVTVKTHDVLIQHLRSRFGDYSGTNESHSLRVITGSFNVVVDHCTLMWADDEVASIWTNDKPIHDVTFSNNIIAEGLSGHGFGTIVGAKYNPAPGPDWVDRISIVRNLYANNRERNPSISRDVNAVIANNLCFNARWSFMAFGLNNGPCRVSLLGNHLITGTSDISSNGQQRIAAIHLSKGGKGSQIFLEDNLLTGRFQRQLFIDETGNSTVTKPSVKDDVEILPVSKVYDHVLRFSGAWPAFRDTVERRLIDEVRNNTGVQKNSVSEAGGWPTDYDMMTSRSFDEFLPENPHHDDDRDGYSNIENVLHRLAAIVENGGY